MKRILTIVFLMSAVAFGAPVRQASQAWVNMRLEQVTQQILETVRNSGTSSGGADTNGLSQSQVTANAVSTGVGEIASALRTLFIPGVYSNTNAHPEYVICGASPQYTNAVHGIRALEWVSNGVYGTGTVSVVEMGLTNRMDVGGNNYLYSTTNSVIFRPESGDGYVIASKQGGM